ncbi:MAG: peptidoglycan-binding protein LysM [Polaribacter sp.]
MGLFSFIKNAGAAVFGIGKTTEQENAEKSNQLRDFISSLELEIKDLGIEVDDDAVKLWGEATDLATKEKVVLAVGNSNGVATVDDNLTVAEVEEVEEEAMAQFHTVSRGDTLGKIAKNYYNNAMKYPVIFLFNKPMLSHPDKIYPGQVLRIPPLVD